MFPELAEFLAAVSEAVSELERTVSKRAGGVVSPELRESVQRMQAAYRQLTRLLPQEDG